MSNETKWTPGPWAVTDQYATMVMVESDTESPICDVCASSDYAGRVTPNAEEQANAHLIAAAPELYEALRDLASCHAGTSAAEWDRCWANAEAVMTKARGQS